MSAMMTLQQAAAWIPGARISGDATVAIHRVHSDTRSLQSGDLFVALKGDNFDANLLLERARVQGAAAAICHHGHALPGLPCIEVDDSLAALGALATGCAARSMDASICVTVVLPLLPVTAISGR